MTGEAPPRWAHAHTYPVVVLAVALVAVVVIGIGIVLTGRPGKNCLDLTYITKRGERLTFRDCSPSNRIR